MGIFDFFKKNKNIEKDNHKIYHKNGNLKGEGGMKNGRPHGIWKSYYEDGSLHLEENFVEGKREGKSKLYRITGELKSVGIWKDDKWLYELSKSYDKDGNEVDSLDI